MPTEQILLDAVGADLMSVSQTARFLDRSPDRVRQYAEMYALDRKLGVKHPRGLECLRFGPKRERYFAPCDVANFKRKLDGNVLLRESCTLRAPLAAMRS
jgi:hypothetical protein